MGFFDPLTAAEAKRLTAAANGGRKVLAIVLTSPDSLLSADARAALVAAIRGIDAVVIAEPQQWRSVLGQHANVAIDDDLESDKKRSADFVDFILKRQETNTCPSS